MNKISNVFFAVSAALIITSCSSDSATSVPVEPPIGDISGGWSITEQTLSGTSECNGTDAYDVTISQVESAITVTGTDGGGVTGTLSDAALSLRGSRPYLDGTITYGSIKATIPADCSSFIAQTTWSYAEPGFSCSGSGTIQANRTSGGTTC